LRIAQVAPLAESVPPWEKVMADPRMKPDRNPMPFHGKRMIYGGFEPIVER
jgi:uncharacterized protein YbaA (DUF1428 family)